MEIQPIPDEDTLYYRVHVGEYLRSRGVVVGGMFASSQGSMSTSWSRYADPEEARSRDAAQAPGFYGVIALPVGCVRGIDGMTVEHSPTTKNYAHTDVFGLEPPLPKTLKNDRRHELILCSEGRWLLTPTENPAPLPPSNS